MHNDTINIQYKLADYCRKNLFPNIPLINHEGIKQYRKLVYNVIEETLESSFPITRKTLTNSDWDYLVSSFIEHHKCISYSIWKMPEEFLNYITKNNFHLKELYPFLSDLLYFEWIEIEVHTMPDETVSQYKKYGNLFSDKLVLNPEFRLVNLNYPVHNVRTKELLINQHKGSYHVLIFRDLETGSVKFYDLSRLFSILINEIIQNSEKTLIESLAELCGILKIDVDENIKAKVLDFMKQLLKDGFILGFKKTI